MKNKADALCPKVATVRGPELHSIWVMLPVYMTICMSMFYLFVYELSHYSQQ